VVFLEAFLGGYPKGLDFGARVGMRSPEGRDLFRCYYEGAVAVPGPAADALGAAARAHGLHLVIGVVERDGRTLYCTALFFGPDGALLGKHRKVMPTAMERLIWGFGDGSTLGVVATPLGRLGAAICWETYMPQLRLALYGQGVQLYCAPTVDDPRPGCRRCATLRSRSAASCSRPASLPAAAISRPTSRPSRATSPTPRSFAAAAASSTRSARCWPGRSSTRRRS